MNCVKFSEALHVLPQKAADVLRFIPNEIKENTYEIRLRKNKPLVLFGKNESKFLYENSTVSSILKRGALIISEEDIKVCTEKICAYSVYSHQLEMAEGFVTFGSGFRAGFSGTAVMSQNKISALRDITSVNIRIPGEYPDAADSILDRLYSLGGFHGLLIAGAPCSGKTTLLKSMAHKLSSEYQYGYLKTVIVDERFELNAVSGTNCDILCGYPKKTGIIHATRVLSPQLIICDEIAEEEEAESVIKCLHAGIKFVASIHCGSEEDLYHRPIAQWLIQSGAFEYCVLLNDASNPGTVRQLFKTEDITNENNGDSVCAGKLLFSGIPHHQ